MRKRKPLKFEEIPAWAIDSSERSRYTIVAAFRLADLTDNKSVRLTAETQRNVFGAVLFGKCLITVGNEGIGVTRSVCFGTDFSGTNFSWERVEELMKEGRRPVL